MADAVNDTNGNGSDAFDAEAALLALGPALAWEPTQAQVALGPNGNTLFRQVIEARTSTDTLYSIRQEDDAWTATFYGEDFYASLKAEPDRCPLRFPSEAAAKAACERHHASLQEGSKAKWEL